MQVETTDVFYPIAKADFRGFANLTQGKSTFQLSSEVGILQIGKIVVDDDNSRVIDFITHCKVSREH